MGIKEINSLETVGQDRMILVDADGIIHSMILDLEQMTCITEEKKSFNLPAHTMGNTIDIGFNPFDNKIFFVLEKDFCEVLYIGFHSLCRIPQESGAPFFKGAQFLSARTILLWDENGTSMCYYMGPSSNLLHGPCGSLNNSDIILMSDGNNAVYVESLIFGPYPLYNTVTCISICRTNGMRTRLRTVPSNATDLCSSIIGFSTERLQDIRVHVFVFWASLFASNLTAKKSNSDPISSAKLSIACSKSYDMKDLFWTIPKIESKFTVMAVFMKKYVAVGYSFNLV